MVASEASVYHHQIVLGPPVFVLSLFSARPQVVKLTRPNSDHLFLQDGHSHRCGFDRLPDLSKPELSRLCNVSSNNCDVSGTAWSELHVLTHYLNPYGNSIS